VNPRELLEASFRAAIEAADPRRILRRFLPQAPGQDGTTLVVAIGKAAASMAQAAEEGWPGGAPLHGIALTRYGHTLPTRYVQVVEAAHPVPDAAGERAARQILDEVRRLRAHDLLLALISGGGSSLLALPSPSLPLGDLQAVTRSLLASGASIQEINAVRKHLSSVQGGRLAAACAASICALVISDVAGDDITHIASGPFAPDPTTYAEALRILCVYGITPPAVARALLEAGARGEIPETPKPGDALFSRVRHHVIASARQSLEAAAEVFRRNDVHPVILGDSVTGEAREVAKVFAAIARQAKHGSAPFRLPAALISGGECTVALGRTPGAARGLGGRCAEYLLSLAIELAREPGIHALACDTDGIDGTGHNAGALIAPDTLARARDRGLDPRKALAKHDSHGFFDSLGDLVLTGPTFTNVNDYRAVLVTRA